MSPGSASSDVWRRLARQAADVGRQSLSTRVVALIENEILLGNIKGGERLPTEAKLEEVFGVSRSVIRDAMRVLAARDLIRIVHGRGMLVAEPSSDGLIDAMVRRLARAGLTKAEVWAARSTIETGIVPFAVASATDDDISYLEDEMDRFRLALRDESWEECALAHLRFHQGLLAAVRLPALALLLEPMGQIILLSSIGDRQLDQPDLWDYDTHPPILDALRDRDEERLRQVLRTHHEHGFDPNDPENSNTFSASIEDVHSMLRGFREEAHPPQSAAQNPASYLDRSPDLIGSLILPDRAGGVNPLA